MNRFESLDRKPQYLGAPELSPTIEQLVPSDFPNREKTLREAKEILEKGELQEKLEAIISRDPSQERFNLKDLLDLRFSTASESIASAQIFENVIKDRWAAGAYEMECDVDVEKLRENFSSAPDIEYEFMPTKLHQEAIRGGVGKLLIGFPTGAKEQDKAHTHPGGRIVIAVMDNAAFHSPEEGRGRQMRRGSAILMPAEAPHNFVSEGDRSSEVPEDLVVDDILDKKVPGTVFLSFHIGYEDIASGKALKYIKKSAHRN